MKKGLYIFAAGFVGALVAVVLSFTVRALADGDPGTDQVPKWIAYHGTLEKDGVGLNATVQMKFEIFDGSVFKWDEVQPVPVYSGRFSVLLGSTSGAKLASLLTTVKAADELFLAVSIKSGNDWITLSGKQRFLPSPYAVWSTASTDLTAATINGLKDGGKLYINTNGQTSDLGGNLAVYGPDFTYKAHPERGDGGRALVHETGDKLVLNYAGDLSGGTTIAGPGTRVEGQEVSAAPGGGYTSVITLVNGGQQAWMDGNEIDSNQKLYLNGNTKNGVEIGGHLSGEHFGCRDFGCGAKEYDLPGSGGFGSWKDWSKCDAGYYVCGMKQRTEEPCGSDCDDTGTNDIIILCCPF